MKILKKYLIRFAFLLKKTYLYDDFLKAFFSFELTFGSFELLRLRNSI